ncbi:MAG: hypothetical protein WA796_05490 [Pseudolabrys sp.]
MSALPPQRGHAALFDRLVGTAKSLFKTPAFQNPFKIAAPPARRQLVGLQSARESGMAKLIKARKKSASAKKTYIEPITCPHCGGQAYLMRRTPHPEIKGEVWTFESKDCGKQTEKSKLN